MDGSSATSPILLWAVVVGAVATVIPQLVMFAAKQVASARRRRRREFSEFMGQAGKLYAQYSFLPDSEVESTGVNRVMLTFIQTAVVEVPYLRKKEKMEILRPLEELNLSAEAVTNGMVVRAFDLFFEQFASVVHKRIERQYFRKMNLKPRGT